MIKKSNRVLKIPTNRAKSKLVFQYIDRVENFLAAENSSSTIEREPIELHNNPVSRLSDFQRKTWPDEVIALLKPWIKQTTVATNFNLAAKLAIHTQRHSDCLEYLLKSLNTSPSTGDCYLTHTKFNVDTTKGEEIKLNIKNVMAKRIKEIGIAILNEQKHPELLDDELKKLKCLCKENTFLPFDGTIQKNVYFKHNAVDIIDKCMSLFPSSPELWELCFRICKDYFLDNKLPVNDLELILRKYMTKDVHGMASAIMFGKDCQDFNQILSPTFYLSMCTEVLNTWG